MNLQIAEYELQNAKKSTPSNSTKTTTTTTTNTSSKKRSSTENLENSYEQKKARLESTLENYSSYLNNEDDSTENSMQSGEEAASESERLIKTGEMTPFGGCIDFESGKSRQPAEKKSKTVSSNSSTTDFDSFLLDLDRKKAETIAEKHRKEINTKIAPQQKKVEPVKKKSTTINYKDTNATDFDMFLSEFDNNKPKTSKQANQVSANQPTTSLAVSSADRSVAKKPTPPKYKPKLTAKSVVPAKTRPVVEKSPIDKLSFMRAIEESDESEAETNGHRKIANIAKTPKKSVAASSSKPKVKASKVVDLDENANDVDLENDDSDPDYDKMDGLSDTSSVEYETDDDDDSSDWFGKKKRKKYCLSILIE